jgi:hypothetical protein
MRENKAVLVRGLWEVGEGKNVKRMFQNIETTYLFYE